MNCTVRRTRANRAAALCQPLCQPLFQPQACSAGCGESAEDIAGIGPGMEEVPEVTSLYSTLP